MRTPPDKLDTHCLFSPINNIEDFLQEYTLDVIVHSNIGLSYLKMIIPKHCQLTKHGTMTQLLSMFQIFPRVIQFG